MGTRSGTARSHQQVGLPSPRGADQVEVLVGRPPSAGGQVVERGSGVAVTRGRAPPGRFRV